MRNKIFLFFFFSFFLCFSQNIQYSGLILDNSNNPLDLVNVSAIPEVVGHLSLHSTTDEFGRFELSLEQGLKYQIIIGHLSYELKKFELVLTNNVFSDIILQERVEELDEITISYTPKFEIRKDTIVYDADSFRTGEERKVRELLKKMNGLEVDKEGNVTSNGKKITKLLVNNKVFFTGSTKLGVNNIPADVVDKIEILDNYNSVSFLKDFEDTDQIALNIKLKKDKDKFIFGDIELGGDFEDRYLIHPNIFYYSPETNINFISDINNTGEKSFTFGDYLEFEGGFGKLMGDVKSYRSIVNSDFVEYLSNTNFISNKSQFSAFNIRQSLSSHVDFSFYLIADRSISETKIVSKNQYLLDDFSIVEQRNSENFLDNFFIIGKLGLEYKPSSTENLTLNNLIKISNSSNSGIIDTYSSTQDDGFRINQDLDNVQVSQNLEYSKKVSNFHTFSVENSLTISKNNPKVNFFSKNVFLQNLVPLLNDINYSVFQKKKIQNTNFDLLLKDYWVINNYNHVYITLGTSLIFENYSTDEIQILSNNVVNDFVENGFGNKVDYNFNDIFLGLEYKFLFGIYTLKSALFMHNYSWKNVQLGGKIFNTSTILLPNLTVEAEISSSERIKFKYDSSSRLPNSMELGNSFLISDFNSVFVGNNSLSFERNHNFLLTYNKYSLFRGSYFNAFLSYNKSVKSIKNASDLSGINQLTSLIMFDRPENSLLSQFIFSKKTNIYKYSLDAMAGYSDFFQLVNSQISKNSSKSLALTNKIETYFENLPNLEIGYTYSPTRFKTSFTNSDFKKNEFFLNLNYVFFKDFRLITEYSKVNFTNFDSNIINTFDMADLSIFYKKEDSSWGIEFSVTNLFDTKFKKESLFNDFLISDQSTFILPRIIQFKISYKL
ncbi:TonB-dependent receptor [Cellulophaga baltica]|uniref:TonB-dependent receptor n=1 Tax=Cellulophaga baltica TaxID=76594 RepID=UPI0004117850|nr:TonB-dependent receptor [Cellulophaga baltica]